MSTLRAVELIKTAAENIDGFTFITGTRFLSNIEADNISLPICILDRPLTILKSFESGGLLLENFRCTVFFFDKSELEYQFEEHEPIIGRMNLAANQFLVNLNSFTDYVRSITQISGIDPINALDSNLTGVQFSFELTLYPLDEQVCPTGTFDPSDLPAFNRYLTEVAVDGVTITGNGTIEDPLVAIGGGGGSANVSSGQWNPTSTNIGGTNPIVNIIYGNYSRVESVVTCSLFFEVEMDAAEQTASFLLDLPIPSNFDAEKNAFGIISYSELANGELASQVILANPSNDKVQFNIGSTSNGFAFQYLTAIFQYVIINP
jgi:hypothetical protein